MPFDKQLTRLLSNDASLIAEEWAAGNLDDAMVRAAATRYTIKAIERAIRSDKERRDQFPLTRIARALRVLAHMCYHSIVRG